MAEPDLSADTFALIARSLAEQVGLEATLQCIVELAVQTVPGAEHAAVSLVRVHKDVETVAASSELSRRVDLVQYATGEGPCLDAIWQAPTVEIDDLSCTDRWPAFAPRAVDLGVLSMLALRLFVEEDTAGALNLYSGSREAFRRESVDLGHVFAAHAALAYDHENELAGLRAANESRNLIGQAQGLLMAEHKVGADQAFLMLTRRSQNSNRKLRDVARDVVDAVRT